MPGPVAVLVLEAEFALKAGRFAVQIILQRRMKRRGIRLMDAIDQGLGLRSEFRVVLAKAKSG